MVKKVKTFARITLGVALIAIFVSCKKDFEVSVASDTSIQQPTILDLKNYMAILINADADDIKYNERTESFSLFGVDQISKQQLTEFYNNAKN